MTLNNNYTRCCKSATCLFWGKNMYNSVAISFNRTTKVDTTYYLLYIYYIYKLFLLMLVVKILY